MDDLTSYAIDIHKAFATARQECELLRRQAISAFAAEQAVRHMARQPGPANGNGKAAFASEPPGIAKGPSKPQQRLQGRPVGPQRPPERQAAGDKGQKFANVGPSTPAGGGMSPAGFANVSGSPASGAGSPPAAPSGPEAHPLFDKKTGGLIDDAPSNEHKLAQAVNRGEIPPEQIAESHPELARDAVVEQHRREEEANTKALEEASAKKKLQDEADEKARKAQALDQLHNAQ